jgi:ribonuclease D
MKKEITKEEVNDMDMDAFKGTIYVADDKKGAAKAIKMLKGETVLGFDTETRPSFRKGEKYDPSLMQLATEDVVVLFRLHSTGLPKGLVKILENPDVIKAGIAIDRDLEELQELREFNPAGFIDLNSFAPEKGFKSVGVRRLAALVLGFRVSKRQQTSNWEAEQLKPQQLEYAATDAWVCREIYEKIKVL